ncbi:MAG: bacteriohemerythrin [Rhodocyclaceae bacterium]
MSDAVYAVKRDAHGSPALQLRPEVGEFQWLGRQERDAGLATAIFQWDDSYRVGIEEIDRQHQALVEMINIIDAAVSEGVAAAVVAKLLSDLRAYTRYHFAAEEQLMLEGNCDPEHLRAHLRQHRDFERSLSQIRRAYDVSGPAVAGSLLEFLLNWLKSHMLASDLEMGRLLGYGGGADAGENYEFQRELQLERQLEQEVAERNMLNALREAETRFRMIADMVPVLVWMGESGGGRSFFNRTWVSFTGRDAGHESGWGWLTGVHPEDRGVFLESFRSALRERTEYVVEYRLRRADGAFRWMVEQGVPRSSRSGVFGGFVGSTTDITERKAAECKALRACTRLEKEAADRVSRMQQLEARLSELRLALSEGRESSAERTADLLQQVDRALDLVSGSVPRGSSGTGSR